MLEERTSTNILSVKDLKNYSHIGSVAIGIMGVCVHTLELYIASVQVCKQTKFR
jgi:hypothetical protein